MLRTSTDSRTRAQRFADSRWWNSSIRRDDGQLWDLEGNPARSVKVVGYATHQPVWDIGDRRVKVYSVELLHCDGHKTTRWVSVAIDIDAYECTGIMGSVDMGGVPKTWRHKLAERSV